MDASFAGSQPNAVVPKYFGVSRMEARLRVVIEQIVVSVK